MQQQERCDGEEAIQARVEDVGRATQAQSPGTCGTHGLQVTGAALAVGAVPSPGEDQAAKSFFEDLLRRGRLKVPKAAKSATEVVRAAAPSTHESHTHELRREGRHMVLRRVRIDCGFAHIEYRFLPPVSCAVEFGGPGRG
jgi:hypothetical protein